MGRSKMKQRLLCVALAVTCGVVSCITIEPDSEIHETTIEGGQRQPTKSEIWQRLIYDQAYDTGDIPPGGQVVVAVDMKVNRVGNLNPSAGVAEMQVTLRTKWTDKRLAWNAITTRSGPEKDLDGLLTVVMSKPDEAKDLIWRPDVTITNVVAVDRDRARTLTVIAYIGKVLWSRVIDGSFAHTFDFSWFPFDTQMPAIRIESFKYNDRYQHIQWAQDEDAASVATSMGVIAHSVFNISGVYHYTTRSVYKDVPDLVWVRLTMKIIMDRLYGSYLLKVLFPVSMMVYISVLSYFIQPGSAPARVGLSVTCMLTQVAFGRATASMIPITGALGWLDYFLLVALIHNTAALVEYSIVYTLMLDEENKAESKILYQKIDETFRWMIPTSFTLITFGMLIAGLSHEPSHPALG